MFDFVSKEEVALTKVAYDKLGTDNGIKPIYEYLKEKIEYHKIRLAIGFFNKKP